MTYPRMIRIKQRLNDTQINNIEAAVRSEMTKSTWASRIRFGEKVAITAGSRGITNIVRITAAIVNEIRGRGGVPYIVPAMGSHGGADAAGQIEVLKGYGMTEDTVGAPILSSMEVVPLGQTESNIPVFMDQKALEADHIIVVNRIKPHTEFHGQIESGLIKMMVIGLGKHKGAISAHQFAVKYGYEGTLIEIARSILKKAPISLGIGIIENGYGETALIRAVEPDRFVETEKTLLEEARRRKPKLPFDEMDILIVDESGKEISGTGMDTKVVGRIMNIYEPELTQPRITRILLRDLTEKTHGNATGIGLADFITKRVADKMDREATGINCITAVTPEKARLPIVCRNDQEAIDFALATSGPVDARSVRMVWIKNTSDLCELFVSEGLRGEAQMVEKVEILGEAHPMAFDPRGNLIELWDKTVESRSSLFVCDPCTRV